ncbi:LysR family transcriptional regulator [Rhodanobacter glycinis]|uniref:LysR family transcriptional regulator n=1 Tax=Rhodanobacter glycinis TaxID=582702 RepID=A0A502BX12_9GAMM|nr:LysR family transcriptional regulator [Rhodanobacter glycinis]TPG04924.1 LysR family transcriptional regulator [Rhodanobacter glycinis]
MDHLQAMRAFARVVETGSFVRAAESLQMPAATLSKAIQALEKHLQVRLLERTTRRVSVTEDGAAYHERVRHLLEELDDLEATLGRARSNPRGRLRVDTGGSVASGILIPALPQFRATYPDIELQLGVTDRTVDLIGENIDCAIRNSATDPALIARRIGALAWTTCASPDYLARHGIPLRPEQIEGDGHVVAGYFSARTGRNQPLHFLDAGRPLLIEPHTAISVNESNAHVATALAGLGLIHTLDFMVRPAIESGALVAVLESWRPAPQEVYIVYPPSRQLSTKLRVFVEWAAELFAPADASAAAASRLNR